MNEDVVKDDASASGGRIGEPVDIEGVDFDKARMELGDMMDENGVSLWDVLKSLQSYGVKKVNMV